MTFISIIVIFAVAVGVFWFGSESRTRYNLDACLEDFQKQYNQYSLSYNRYTQLQHHLGKVPKFKIPRLKNLGRSIELKMHVISAEISGNLLLSSDYPEYPPHRSSSIRGWTAYIKSSLIDIGNLNKSQIVNLRGIVASGDYNNSSYNLISVSINGFSENDCEIHKLGYGSSALERR